MIDRMSNAFTRETIENWVSDFCMSDDLRPFSGPVKEVAADVLVQFLSAACEVRGVEPQDVEEPDVKQALLGHVARLNLPEQVKTEMPALVAALLNHLERAGRLGGGGALGAYTRALQQAYDEAASGKRKPIVRPGSKI